MNSAGRHATLFAIASRTERAAGGRALLDESRFEALSPRSQRALLTLVLTAAATAVYCYHLGYQALGPSEAYSALAAAQPTIGAVAHNALQFDPGKPVLYHLLLHWFGEWFGYGEASLRAFSLFCGLASLALIFAYGNELFGFEVGFVAAALWAFNPIALLFARWARMYSLFVALTLAHLLAMSRLHRKSDLAMQFLAGVLGAAMLYSHLGAVLFIAADVVVMLREFRHYGRSMTGPAVAIAIVLFIPFMPIGLVQTRALLFGHWLDWVGVNHATTASRVLVAALAGAAVLWLTLAGRSTDKRSEAFRCCLIYALLPPLALAAGSILVRPMFSIRYVAPSLAVATVTLAFVFDRAGARVRNEAAFALSLLLLMLAPLTYAALSQPWREIAGTVAAAGGERQTIFFESGFFSDERLISEAQSAGFPNGFFRVPFNYYFKQSNPRGVLPGSDPEQSRQLIEVAVRSSGGAWLISGKAAPNARAELPSGTQFEIDFEKEFSRILLFHVRLVRR